MTQRCSSIVGSSPTRPIMASTVPAVRQGRFREGITLRFAGRQRGPRFRNPPVLPKLAAVSLVAPMTSFILVGVGGRDDAYITYGAARQLLEHGRILNINGEWIEQSSSLLHVMLLAAGSFLTRLPLPWVGWGLSLVAAYLTALFVGLAAERLRPGSGVFAVLFCATTTPLLYWAVGRVETPIETAILSAIVLVGLDVIGVRPRRRRRVSLLIVLVVLMAMVRPEGAIILVASFLLAAVILRLLPADPPGSERLAPRDLVLLAGGSGLVLLGLTAFRLALYGVVMPQPVLAKAAFSLHGLGEGVDYVRSSLDMGSAFVIVLAGIGAWTSWRRQRTPVLIIISMSAVLVCFVVGVGGDWMELGRFLCPPLALLCILGGVGLRSVIDAGIRRSLVRGVAAVLILGCSIGIITGLDRGSQGSPIWATVTWTDPQVKNATGTWVETRSVEHRRDIPAAIALGDLIDSLASSGVRPVVVASHQAGFVMFKAAEGRSGAFRFIDLLSLSTNSFDGCDRRSTKSPLGTRVDVRPWTKGASVCGLDPPDVILGPDRSIATDSGYTIVFSQGGTSVEAFLTSTKRKLRQWIAVRDDLLPMLPADDS